MKLGIVTFINTINYGALLQAYALQEVIKKFGINAEIIQYTNEIIENKEKNKGKKSVKMLFKDFIMRRSIERKIKFFEKYENSNINKGLKLANNTIEKVNAEYDLFIAGSDQVWNMDITHEDWTYFLDFVSDDKKKISYAPSFGNTIFPKKDYAKAIEYLNSFKALSVREKLGQQLISKLIQKEVPVVLDPTLLLNKLEWEEKIKFQPPIKDYILVYFPHNKKLVFDFVKKLKDKYHLPVIYLSISPRVQLGVKTIYDASPDEFLGWIKNASYVVTGSFHGTAFSLNLEKQFFFEPSGDGSRIDNLVKLTNVQNRSILEHKVMESTINFDNVKCLLENERIKSKKWLKEALGVENNE